MFYLCPNKIPSKILRNKIMAEKEDTSVISLRVNSEQREAIIQFFNFNNWDLEEATGEGIQSNADETDENGDVLGNFERTFHIPQDNNVEECPHCFCRPCITNERNHQMWWKSECEPPSRRNSSLRKEKYKFFWTMLFHRGVFQDPRYKSRKLEIMHQNPRLRGVVCHRRDVLPSCVLETVRRWLPNLKNVPYMGHRWE